MASVRRSVARVMGRWGKDYEGGVAKVVRVNVH